MALGLASIEEHEMNARTSTDITSGVPPTAAPLSRLDRIRLFLHRSLDRWLSPLGVWVMRRTRGGVAGAWKVDALLLTTRGRRSGRERTVVLQFFPDGEAMILAAANDGGTKHPGWYFNLKAAPEARVEVSGQTIPVHAEELPPEEAVGWWQRIVEHAPDYRRYQRATTRTFPILRLVPTATQGSSDSTVPFG
jgi:deazaflavin-dependent oxidoreductase (nitroreductase family)